MRELLEARYPDFLGIGAQKAGTTWLFENLSKHPAVWMPPGKELHYFDAAQSEKKTNTFKQFRRKQLKSTVQRHHRRSSDSDDDREYKNYLHQLECGPMSDQWYANAFSPASSELVCGEITPAYSTLSKPAMEHVRKLIPKTKAILIVRDPVDRCWSQLRMQLRKASTTHDMAGFVRLRLPKLVANSDYPRIINRWSKALGRENILVLAFDEISCAPSQLLESICNFLEIEYSAQYFVSMETAVHKGQPEPMPERVRAILKERLRPIYDRFGEQMPSIAARWASKHF